MACIEGIIDKQAGLFMRALHRGARRKIGRLPEPVRMTAHQPRLLAALGGMELAQEAMRTVDPVKALVGIKAAFRRKAGVSEAKLMGLVDFEGCPSSPKSRSWRGVMQWP